MASGGRRAVELQPPTTLVQSFIPSPQPTPSVSRQNRDTILALLEFENANHDVRISRGVSSTGKGILIGMLSAFGSALFIALVLSIIYFFRYTSRGRILLDRLGRPGEFDDEQAFVREEAEALEQMDELQRTEYMRAKGMQCPLRALVHPDDVHDTKCG